MSTVMAGMTPTQKLNYLIDVFNCSLPNSKENNTNRKLKHLTENMKSNYWRAAKFQYTDSILLAQLKFTTVEGLTYRTLLEIYCLTLGDEEIGESLAKEAESKSVPSVAYSDFIKYKDFNETEHKAGYIRSLLMISTFGNVCRKDDIMFVLSEYIDDFTYFITFILDPWLDKGETKVKHWFSSLIPNHKHLVQTLKYNTSTTHQAAACVFGSYLVECGILPLIILSLKVKFAIAYDATNPDAIAAEYKNMETANMADWLSSCLPPVPANTVNMRTIDGGVITALNTEILRDELDHSEGDGYRLQMYNEYFQEKENMTLFQKFGGTGGLFESQTNLAIHLCDRLFDDHWEEPTIARYFKFIVHKLKLFLELKHTDEYTWKEAKFCENLETPELKDVFRQYTLTSVGSPHELGDASYKHAPPINE